MPRLTLPAILVAVIVVLPARFVAASDRAGKATPETNPPSYVSSDVCAQCHQKEHAAWRTSHHSWALRLPTPGNVLGDFDDAVFEHRRIRSRFFKHNGKFFVETQGTNGKLTEYEIKYTVGVEPLQQYLVELDRGRLQALDIAWDTEQKRWFHLYPGQEPKAGDGLHWTGPYKNWQARCAECHQTNFVKGYAPKAKSYQSSWSELAVGCESCHGPGQAHVFWAKEPAAFRSRKPADVDDKGLTVFFPLKAANEEIRLCARCHSRRSPLGANSPLAGSEFADHYKLALLRGGLYHADGQINDEVYVYGSFLQSKMYARGVRCSNCHEPHSGTLVAEGNAVCTQCHSPAGNSAFPTLTRKAYDDTSHHRHEAGSQAAKCVSCHMPSKTYMRVDPRRDHSFRVPRPDLSEKLATPNACTGCHADRSADWAASAVRDWFPAGRAGTPHYGEMLHAGRNKPGEATTGILLELALDETKPAIVRASALGLIRGGPVTLDLARRIAPLLRSEEALIREATLRLFAVGPARLRVGLAGPVLSDPARVVRLEAARLVAGVPLDTLGAKQQTIARSAIRDYQTSLFDRSDYPETQMQIAGLAMTLKRFDTAQQALQTALSMDPQLADAWLSLARIQTATRQPERARKTLEKAARKVPDNATVHFQLGALYASARDHARAIQALEKSLKLAGSTPALLDLLAVNHLAHGNLEKARAYADDLAISFPEHRPSPAVRQLLETPKER